MKMILEFNLPEEQQDANDALNVQELVSAVNSYANKLRNTLKHADDPVECQKAEWAQKLFLDELQEVMVKYNG